MLKIITVITKFILVALTALLFASCNYSVNSKSIRGSGNVTTENRTIDAHFNSIEVSNAIDLIIEQGKDKKVVVEADDNLQNSITTKVENGVLIVGCDYNSFTNIESKKVTVRIPVIEELQASSASTIRSANTLKGEKISLRSSSAASINVKIEADNITSKSSSGSTISMNGLALHLDATASSGSTINSFDLLSNEVNAKSSSGSSIYVHPIVSLKAKASSGSSITYNTIPKTIEKNSSSGGSISRQ